MSEIRAVLKDKYNLNTKVEQLDIVGDNGLIVIQVQPPCTNPDCREEQKRWLLRMAPSESFDRWSVSAAICERFDNPGQIVEYLSDVTAVYTALFKALSNDYKELYDKWEELEFEEFERGNG